jgi:hypothetical protein
LSARKANLTLRAGGTDRTCVSARANDDGTWSTRRSGVTLRTTLTCGADLTRRAA